MPTPISFEELVGFISELRSKGFPIGIDQYLAARQLLESPIARERLSSNPASLVTLLAPLLCNTAEQQEEFYLEYLQWLDQRTRLSRADRWWNRNPIIRLARDRRFRHARMLLWIMVCLGASAIAFEGSIFSTRSKVVPLDGKRLTTPANTSPPILGKSTAPDGPTVPGSPTAPLQESAETSGPPEAGGGEGTGPGPRPVVMAPEEKVEVEITSPVDPGFYRRNYSAIRFGATMLPLLALAVWIILSSGPARKLERQRASTIPRFTDINFSRDPDDLFFDPEFRRGLQSLRRHRPATSRDLDLAATVERTVSSGGWFSPVYAPRHVMPEYLVLIDRSGAADQQSRYFDRIADELVEEGAYVDRYYFHGNPRSCVRGNNPGSHLSLAELKTRHPDHRLLIFSDGEGLFNPIDGTPHHWLDLFAAWDLRVVLTPESFESMKPRLAALLDAGFTILPARPDGIAALGRIVTSEATGSYSWLAPPFPSMLLENREQWLGRVFPGPGVAEDLRLQLLDYLGIEGYYWLATCALFPMIQWELTLDLGRRLLRTEQMEEILPALVGLPWMRHGSMPEWLRISMVASLPSEQLQRMRGAIDQLLEESSRRRDGIGLRMAHQERPDDEPLLYDYVFLCFLDGRTPKQTSVAIPKSLRKIIHPVHGTRFDYRPVLQFSLGALCLLVTVILVMNPSSAVPVPLVTASPASGRPGGEYTLLLEARNAPDDYFDEARLVVLDGRRLSITDLQTSGSVVTARIVVPDGEEAERNAKIFHGKETVQLAIWRGDRMLGTFPFSVKP